MMIELMLITVLAIASIGLAMFLGAQRKSRETNGLGDHEELSGYASRVVSDNESGGRSSWEPQCSSLHRPRITH
jgi:hypothetical protein